jgi:hypothetical protein
MARTKKLTDSTYSPTIAASEEAIRTQIDDSIQEAHDLALEDVTTNRKLSPTGDFTGTINGGDVTLTEPGLSGAFNAHLADDVQVSNLGQTEPPHGLPKCKYDATVAPTVNDDSSQGYSVGSRWSGTVLGKAYECLDATEGAAVWKAGGEAQEGTAQYLEPTGTSDDTSYLQDKFNTYPFIILKPGIYLIDAVTKLTVPSNRYIIFEPGAELHAIANSADAYRILDLFAAENVTLINPVVVGERTTHIGSTGEAGHGIVMSTGKNIKIYNPVCKDCWGDGFVVYGGENVYVENLISDNNRRQGLTMTHGKNVTFMAPRCTNTNGTAPESGIDIEPNDNTDYLENVNIINPVTENNNGAAITIGLAQLLDGTHDISIHISGHVDKGSNKGLSIGTLNYSATGKLTGKIVIDTPLYLDNEQQGILVTNYSAENSPKIEIIKPTIINPNTGNLVSPKYGSGIAIIREIAAGDTYAFGNIYIENPQIIDNRAVPLMKNGIYSVDEVVAGVGISKVIINDPLEITGIALAKDNIRFVVIGSAVIRDKFEATKYETNLTAVTLSGHIVSKVSNLGAGQLAVFTISATYAHDDLYKFVNMTSFGLKIVPTAAIVSPLTTVAGKYIQTTQIGASITIRKISNTQFVIENMVGTWTAES